MAASRRTASIAVAPAVVVGTQHGILSGSTQRQVGLTDDQQVVVPVGQSVGVVPEACGDSLSGRNGDDTRTCTEEGRRIVLLAHHGVELKVSTLHRQAEVEVVGIDGVDALVGLRVQVAVASYRNGLHVGSAVAVVGHGEVHLAAIHGSKPSAPVSMAA